MCIHLEFVQQKWSHHPLQLSLGAMHHWYPKESRNTSPTEGVHAEDDHASLQEDDPYQIDRGCSYQHKDDTGPTEGDHTGPSEGDHTGLQRSTCSSLQESDFTTQGPRNFYRGPSEGPRREGYTCVHGEESPCSYYDAYPPNKSYLPDSPPPLSSPIPPLHPSYRFRSDPIPYSYAPSSASSDAGYSRWQVHTCI